jgi:hypothetical protein
LAIFSEISALELTMSEFSTASSNDAAAADADTQQQAEHDTSKPKKTATLEPLPAHSHHNHDHAHDADTCDEDNCTHGEDEAAAAAAAEKPVLLPGDIVDLVPGAEDLYIVGTVDGFGKVTQIAGLDEMTSLKVHVAAIHSALTAALRADSLTIRVCFTRCYRSSR